MKNLKYPLLRCVPIGVNFLIIVLQSLYARLQQVDPVMATKLHENDTRKIARSLQVLVANLQSLTMNVSTLTLQVFEESGQKHSDLIRQTGGHW